MFLLPGFLLLLIAAIAPLWRKGWPLPMALSVGVAALDLYVFQVGHILIIGALAALALGVLLWDIRSFLEARRRPKSVREFEEHVDRWTERQLRKLVDTARADLPMAEGRLSGDNVMLLKSFPKSDRLDRGAIMARIGTDHVPRMSPVGLAAFDFGPTDVVVFEGAVDLRTTEAVYMRIHQFPYDSIAAVNWSSDVWPPEPADQKRGGGLAQQLGDHRGGKGKAAVLRRDELQVLLVGHHDISIVFRDGMLAERLEDRKFHRIERIDRIREVWRRLTHAGGTV